MSRVKNPIPGVVYPSEEDAALYERLELFGSVTMDQALRDLAQRFSGRIAISNVGVRITWQEFDEQTDLLAAGLLRAGLAPLDRVIFQLQNCPELVLLFAACLKAGLIPVCTLAAHRMAEIGFLAAHAGARAHVVHADESRFDFVAFSRDLKAEVPSVALSVWASGNATGPEDETTLPELVDGLTLDEARTALSDVPRDPWQVAVFQLSGGTSGTPKIIPRFHNEYLYQIRTTARFLGLNEESVAYSPAPMMHNAPIVCYWGSVLWSGGNVVCSPVVTPEDIAELLETCRPNWMNIPLPLLVRMEKAGALNRARFAGAKMSAAGDARGLAEMTSATTLPLYGMTEGMISYGREGDPEDVWSTMVGRPVCPHDAFRVIDPETGADLGEGVPGEFVYKGPCTTRGYFDAPARNAEAFTEDGFIKSGDLMSLHRRDGTVFLRFEGRLKDVVSRGGEKINCLEIEQALSPHPAIGAIAIVPMPDPDYGERMCAFIIPAEGHEAPTVQEAGNFLEKAGIAKFKWPERIEVVDGFPLTSSGKLSKPKLREIAADLVRQPPATEQAA